jgi:hypothetical protein
MPLPTYVNRVKTIRTLATPRYAAFMPKGLYAITFCVGVKSPEAMRVGNRPHNSTQLLETLFAFVTKHAACKNS